MEYITSTNCSSSVELVDILTKATSSSMIQVLLNDPKPKVIVIDEFETMMSLDRTISTALYNIMASEKLRMVPIICIVSNEAIKRIGNIKKKCKIVELLGPTEEQLFAILKKLYPDKDDTLIKNACKNSPNNISQAIEKMQTVESCNMDDNLNVCNLYSSYDQYDIEKYRKILLTDPWMIPLRYHENLITELSKRRMSSTEHQKVYKEFMENLLVFDNLIYNNSVDIAVDVFASASYPLTKMPLKKKAVSNIDGFTKILSYLSLQKKNSKHLYSGLYQIGSYHINITGRNYMFLE
jgi:hypothetical protein